MPNFHFVLGLFSGFILYRVAVLFVRWRRMQKPVTEMHIEHYTNILHLKQYCRAHPDMMLMFMPHNGKQNELVDLPNPKGLHLHLAPICEINQLPFETQKRLIQKALQNLSVPVEDFAAGWWSFNKNTVKACREFGIKRIHVYRRLKRWIKIVEDGGLEPVLVHRYMHDWDVPTHG